MTQQHFDSHCGCTGELPLLDGACPQCESSTVRVETDHDMSYPSYWSYCNTCGDCGPVWHTVAEVQTHWPSYRDSRPDAVT